MLIDNLRGYKVPNRYGYGFPGSWYIGCWNADKSKRLNYILWVQDLLDTSNDSYTDRYDPQREVVGLDV